MRLLPQFTLAVVVAAGSAARLVLHEGVTYSPADELVYARYSCRIADGGLGTYPDLVREYLADQNAHLYPSPARWGFLLPDAAASSALGCGQSSVAWVSTLAGIGMLLLVAALTYRRFGPWVAVLATTFVASSPLQLLVGRRALGDEVVGLVTVAALWAVVAYLERRSWRRLVVAVLLITAGFATKEIFFLLYPALLAPFVLAWARARRIDLRDLLVLGLPPLVNAAVFAVLARDLGAYGQVLRAVRSTIDAPYPTQYMAGPPYRLVLDLMVLAPVVVLMAIAAYGLLLDRGTSASRMTAVLVVASLLPFGLVGAQVVRLVVATDTLLCVLAAWGLVAALRGRQWWWAAAVATMAVAVNCWVFWAVSIQHQVYDPVSDQLLRALGIIP
ncbi:MAG: hypothetical protein JWO11_184 [Nocardioides sp.]|nr:hypothetical protein [Nocardioides sp.]